MQASIDHPLIVLASKSPRRRYLLNQAGLSFSVIPSNFDETTVPMSSPHDYVRVLAEEKTKSISEKYEESWVIGADTIVLIGNTILGKPNSTKEARAMLKRLSGRNHRVITGYAICCKSKNRHFSETAETKVCFKKLTDSEIEWYIHTEEPFDKAGGYAIQGLGMFLVRRINGSYTNVVGLPVCEIIEFLLKEGAIQHMGRRKMPCR
ncbi:MAG: Maf family protein [Desulfobacterales bacterium]|nr:septum formation inhibitor Maf [Desulfobacter sp.]MDP6681982.1 Maf family protein [Desulfobacterales bacterium]MDP6808242.1 Maf family protein [Desulfobacterales bacterium]